MGGGGGHREGFKIVEWWEAGITFLLANTSPKRLQTQLKDAYTEPRQFLDQGLGKRCEPAAHKGKHGEHASGADHPLQTVLGFSSEGDWLRCILGAAAAALTSKNKQTIKLWKLGGVGKEQPRNHAI